MPTVPAQRMMSAIRAWMRCAFWAALVGVLGAGEVSQALGQDFPTYRLPATEAPLSELSPELLPSAGPAGEVYYSQPDEILHRFGGRARAYYINDQRLEWTGQEATFTAEGVVDCEFHQQVGEWECLVAGEFFLNLPFDGNILAENDRAAFAPIFDIEPFQISQLYLAARRENVALALGRIPTPFGRYYYPRYRNNFDDSPFIRSEAILYRETGVLAEWKPAGWALSAALTNGGFGQDTNSSKAGIVRVGLEGENFAIGGSYKVQDGVGSEWLKMYRSHAGLDAMVRWGNWTLSGEVIHDLYGFRDNNFDPTHITWGRSIYFRDNNLVDQEPLTGLGYYVNLGYESARWSLTANYGHYFPLQEIGIPAHDEPIPRALLKASHRATPNLETYGVLLLENTVPYPFTSHPFTRYGFSMICGCQFSL